MVIRVEGVVASAMEEVLLVSQKKGESYRGFAGFVHRRQELIFAELGTWLWRRRRLFFSRSFSVCTFLSLVSFQTPVCAQTYVLLGGQKVIVRVWGCFQWVILMKREGPNLVHRFFSNKKKSYFSFNFCWRITLCASVSYIFVPFFLKKDRDNF